MSDDKIKPDKLTLLAEGTVTGRLTMKPIRTESTLPMTLRQVQYPTGRIAIQGGYQWTEGWEGGIEWRDLPLVQVDGNGKELSDG